jgi:pyridoxine/pyridoxamine 5'-phosphate oxidase
MNKGLPDAHFYDDLDATLEELWQRLSRGVVDRRSGLHTVQLATVGVDGAPRVRTVVLRGVDVAARRLRMHTDRRSAKVAELAQRPEVEVCGYDARAKVQLRLRGRAALTTGSGADAAWSGSRPASRVCYRAPAAPGSPLDDPTAAVPAPRAGDDAEAGREHFAVILMTLTCIEWLYLAARGHRRARFDWTGAGWRGGWLAP